jgi:TP901 family phage tail tape measure protein
MPAPVQNAEIRADISQFEAAINKTVQLMGLQGTSIQDLQVKQVRFNQETGKGTAIIEQQLNAQQKLVASLKSTAQGWDVYSAAVKKSVQVQKATTSAGGEIALPKAFLTPTDAARIAEATIFKRAITEVTSAIEEGIETAKKFQIEISLIRTVSQDQQLSMGQWAEGIKSVSNALGIDLVDASKTAYDAIQSQVVGGAQTFQFLKTAGDLARTTGSDIRKAGDTLSSVMSGFKISASQTEYTGAVLFKTVELGRIKIEELTNTMGKVAPSANLMGVSFEEVSAALATLTRQGIKTTDATTLVTNVILKLAKPTQSMTKLINEWGFANSTAAIQTLGFVGVLRKLEQTSDGRLEDLAHYFNEIRSLRGATGLTSSFGDFEKDLQKIKNAKDTFDKAKDIRGESPADRLTKYMNTAKNTLTTEFSSVAVSTLDSITKAFGDSEESARGFTNAILVTGASVVGLKIIPPVLAATSYAATTAATSITSLTIAQTGNNIAFQAGALAQRVYQAALAQTSFSVGGLAGAFTSQIGIMAAAAGAWAIYTAATDSAAVSVNKTESNIQRISETVRNLSAKQSQDISRNQIEAYNKQVADVFKTPLLASAKAFSSAEKQIDALKEKSKDFADSFGVGYKDFLDLWKDGIRQVNQEIGKSQSAIDRSKNSVSRFKESLDSIIRDTQLEYATNFQKVQLNEQYVRQLKAEVTELFQKGGEDNLTEARAKLTDIARIMRENFKTQQEINKENEVAGRKQFPWEYSTGPRVVSTQPLQARLKQLKEFEQELEQSEQRREGKRGANADQLARTAEDKLRQFEAAKKRFSDIDLFKNGKVDEKYLNDKGKLDVEKFYADVTDSAKKLVDLAPNNQLKADLSSKVWEQAGSQIRIAYAQMRKELTEQDQNTLTSMQQRYIEAFKKIQDSLAKNSQDAFAKQGALDLAGQDSRTISEFGDASLGIANRFLNLNNIPKIRDDLQKRQAIDQAQAAFNQAQENVRKNATQVDGQLLPRVQDVDQLSIAFQDLKTICRSVCSC